MKNYFLPLLLLYLLISTDCNAEQPSSGDQPLLQQLQATIQQQGEQLKSQTEMLRSLQGQLDELRQLLPATTRTVTAPLPQSAPPPATVAAGKGKISLSFSGQINRLLNIADDGKRTILYQADNNASNSRLRLVGTARATDDLTIGTRIEVAISPDLSSKVSQSNQSPGTTFDQRWAELSLSSTRFGKLSLGKGDTASNTTAEADLSNTNVVQYSSIADTASGLLFRERGAAAPLTSLKVADIFKSRDGLSRESRLRYDTPEWHGLRVAGSLASNHRADAALFWAAEGSGFKAAAAAAIANPRLDATGLQYDGSCSILHIPSGLNLTLSGGLLERDTLPTTTTIYVKAGWLATLIGVGHTAFGVDYTKAANVPLADDRAWSVGTAVVQSFSRWSTELYLQYRLYAFDRQSGTPVEHLNVGTVGARVKF